MQNQRDSSNHLERNQMDNHEDNHFAVFEDEYQKFSLDFKRGSRFASIQSPIFIYPITQFFPKVTKTFIRNAFNAKTEWIHIHLKNSFKHKCVCQKIEPCFMKVTEDKTLYDKSYSL